jgi:cell division protein ZapA (FtsZ GTPase activity inhibitor)
VDSLAQRNEKEDQVKAPEQLLGEAIRELKEAPSKEWIKGFDAGYAAAIKVIDELTKTQGRTVRLSKDVREKISAVAKTLHHLEDTIHDFTRPVRHSILEDDLKS